MTRKRKIMIFSWIAVFLWMMLIFYLSAQVADESNDLSKGFTQVIATIIEKIIPNFEFDINIFNHIIRKYAHFFVYMVLGILVLNAFHRSDMYKINWALIVCIIYAISDEIHQAFVPGRGPGIKDVFIDTSGSIVGIIIYMIINKLYKMRNEV